MTTLTWNPPPNPGSTSPRYDTILSQVSSDFVNGAECVEAIGGKISVASVEGEGSAFDLWIPAEAAPPEAGTTG